MALASRTCWITWLLLLGSGAPCTLASDKTREQDLLQIARLVESLRPDGAVARVEEMLSRDREDVAAAFLRGYALRHTTSLQARPPWQDARVLRFARTPMGDSFAVLTDRAGLWLLSASGGVRAMASPVVPLDVLSMSVQSDSVLLGVRGGEIVRVSSETGRVVARQATSVEPLSLVPLTTHDRLVVQGAASVVVHQYSDLMRIASYGDGDDVVIREIVVSEVAGRMALVREDSRASILSLPQLECMAEFAHHGARLTFLGIRDDGFIIRGTDSGQLDSTASSIEGGGEGDSTQTASIAGGVLQGEFLVLVSDKGRVELRSARGLRKMGELTPGDEIAHVEFIGPSVLAVVTTEGKFRIHELRHFALPARDGIGPSPLYYPRHHWPALELPCARDVRGIARISGRYFAWRPGSASVDAIDLSTQPVEMCSRETTGLDLRSFAGSQLVGRWNENALVLVDGTSPGACRVVGVSERIYQFVVAPDGQTAVVSVFDGTRVGGGPSHHLQVLDLATGVVKRDLPTPLGEAPMLDRNDEWVLVATRSGRLTRLTWGESGRLDDLATIDAGIACCALSLPSGLVVLGTQAGEVLGWSVEARSVVWRRLVNSPAGRIVAGPGDDVVAVLLDDGSLEVLDASTGKVLWAAAGLSSSGSCGWSPAGRVLLATDRDGSALVLDPGGGRQLLRGASGRCRGHAWHPSGKVVAVAGEGNEITVNDVTTGVGLFRLFGHSLPLVSLTFDALGKHLFSLGGDGRLLRWAL